MTAFANDQFDDVFGSRRGTPGSDRPADTPARSTFTKNAVGHWVSSTGLYALECAAEMDPFDTDTTWFVVELEEELVTETLSGFPTRAEAERFVHELEAEAQ